jgi:SAM-dependent methyltransferase
VNVPEFPPPPGFEQKPIWTGRGFRVGTEFAPVLIYHEPASGWTDELTAFHEEVSDGTHFIDVASRRHTLNTMARWMPRPDATILDIGCSSGHLIRDIQQRFPQAALIGADAVPGPLERLARSMPEIPLLQFDLVRCPLPDACVDVAVLLNVLEHIEDDASAAKQVLRILRPGGIAVIEVPFGPHLFDVYDRQLLHHRRYRMVDIRRVVARAGFEVIAASHLGFFLYPAFRAVKLRSRRYLDAPPHVQREIVATHIVSTGNNPLPGIVMRLEEFMRPWIPFPRGIRCLLTALKG